MFRKQGNIVIVISVNVVVYGRRRDDSLAFSFAAFRGLLHQNGNFFRYALRDHVSLGVAAYVLAEDVFLVFTRVVEVQVHHSFSFHLFCALLEVFVFLFDFFVGELGTANTVFVRIRTHSGRGVDGVADQTELGFVVPDDGGNDFSGVDSDFDLDFVAGGEDHFLYEVEDVQGKLEAANGGVDVFGLFVEVLLAVLNAARGHVGLSHGFYFLEAVELAELVHDAVELVQE